MKTYLIGYVSLNERVRSCLIDAENQKEAVEKFYVRHEGFEIIAISIWEE